MKTDYPIVWQSNGLWHFKRSKRSRTALYHTKNQMIIEHPILTEEVGGKMFFAYVVNP